MRKRASGERPSAETMRPSFEERIGHGHARFEHTAGIVAKIEHETVEAARIGALQRGHGSADVLRSRLAETGDAHVADARLEGLLHDAAHIHRRAQQREAQQLAGARAAHGELHVAAGWAAHARDGAGEVRADIRIVDLDDEVAGEHAGKLCRRSFDGTQDLHRRILGHDFDADARIGAHGAEADLLEFIAVEEGGMRIERRHHASDRLFHQLAVVDGIDVLALDAFVDLGEQTGLFPGQT